MLPRPGPIVAALAPHASRIVFEPLFVLRRKALARLALTGAVRACPLALARAARRFARADLVYINTSVVLDYQIAARAFPGKALLHIHEIPTGVARAVAAPAGAVRAARSLIFNSRATRDSFAAAAGPRLTTSSTTASTGRRSREPTTYDGARPLRVALIGRINRIKGQDVLIAALSRLAAGTRGALRGAHGWRRVREPGAGDAVARRGRARPGSADIVSVEPFAADTAPIYRWADIVAAPSKLPESLGRTAIEAMSFGRPALVSAIGGLTEVVADGETGWHVPPGDAARACRRRSPPSSRVREDWRGFGAAARARYERMFSRSAATRRARRRRGALPGARARRAAAAAPRWRRRRDEASRRSPREWRRLALGARRRGAAERPAFRAQPRADRAAAGARIRRLRLHAGARRRRPRLYALADGDARQHLHRPRAAAPPPADFYEGAFGAAALRLSAVHGRRRQARSLATSSSGPAIGGAAVVGLWSLRSHLRTVGFARRQALAP